MAIIYSDNSSKIQWPDANAHDPNSQKFYYIYYRPEYWNPITSYIKDSDVVLPSVDNGCMYECVSGGISATDEPTWITIEGNLFNDNDVKWRCMPRRSRLTNKDIILTSTWTATSGVSLDSQNIQGGFITSVKVSAISNINNLPLNCYANRVMELTNHISVLRFNGQIEEFDKTIVITVRET